MSGFRTHMLIGAVSGVLLTRTALPDALSQSPQLVGLITPQTAAGGIIVASTVLATWPDIDEPGSWLSRRVHAVLTVVGTLLGVGIGGMLVWNHVLPIWGMAAATLVGMVGGRMAGWLLLRVIRIGSGGHRHLTHSLILALVLFIVACALWGSGLVCWFFLPMGLTWGVLVHLVGDVVTPGGVELLYPLSTKRYRVLPRSIARHGETIITVVVLLVGGAVIWVW